MEAYATALLYAIPMFMGLVFIEWLYGYFKGNQTQNSFDTISSLSSGVTNSIKDSLGLVVVLVSYPFMLEHLGFLMQEPSIAVYLIGFVAIDFASYWNHRLAHSINYFWNRHVVHHSSEEFNLPCALRQSVSEIFGFYAIFLIPAAMLGVPHKVIGVIAPLHLFMQFWYHTKHIPKLGFLEYIIVTPSQHRVHHAINEIYLDKNLGAIFCIWDRLFGTFQEELEEVPPVYGVLAPPKTWNPIKINFQHLWRLMKDAWRTNSISAKFLIWFKPLGWRPDDMKEKYPGVKIGDVYAYQKYDTNPSNAFIAYSFYQLLMANALLYYSFYNYANMDYGSLLLSGVITFVSIYGYTSLMDREKVAPFIETARSIAGLLVIILTGSWFGIHEYFSIGNYLIAFYFLSSIAGAFYFSFVEKGSFAKGVENV